MPFEFKSTDYQPCETNQIQSEKTAELNEEENKDLTDDQDQTESEEDVKVIKSAKNSNYNAPRQDHCFIYKITKLA